NGDLNEDSLDQGLYQPTPTEQTALARAGYRGVPVNGESAANTPFPYWRCLADALLGDGPEETCNGLINRTQSRQHTVGASAQATWLSSGTVHKNQMTLGADYDDSRVTFSQSAELGYLTADRSITSIQPLLPPGGVGNPDTDAFDARVSLIGRQNNWSL